MRDGVSHQCHTALRKVARPAGLEPATPGLEGRCSIHLSYGREVQLLSIGPQKGDLVRSSRCQQRRPCAVRLLLVLPVRVALRQGGDERGQRRHV